MAILWRDKMLSSYNGNLESVMVYNAAGTEKVDVTNGIFVVVQGLEEGQREVKKAVLAEDNSVKDILLISDPEVQYDSGAKLADYVIEAGDVSRALRLSTGDVIILTDDLINGATRQSNGTYRVALAVGDTLAVGAGGKLTAVDTATDTDVAVVFTVREDAGNELDVLQHAWRLDITIE